MNEYHKTTANNRGFTLIEVIAVLIVAGILLAIAADHILSTEHDLISQADIVKSHLRFAQLKALHDDTATWGIAFSNDHYTLRNGNADAAISLPSENSNSYSFSSGVTSATATINFNSWGSPGTNDIPITLSQNGATTTFTITGNTGFITP